MLSLKTTNSGSFSTISCYAMLSFLIVSCSSNNSDPTPSNGEEPSSSLLHQWTFNDGTANDFAGDADGILKNGATIIDGKLVLDGIDDHVRTPPIKTNISRKTLMAWVTLSNVYQRGGGVITLENPDTSCSSETFDSIVYGERVANQWIAGSDFFKRTPDDNDGNLETIQSIEQEIHITIVYDIDNSVRIYRNGTPYSAHTVGMLQSYSANISDVLIGLRHQCANTPGTPNGYDRFLAASINEARIYNTALSENNVLSIFNAGASL